MHDLRLPTRRSLLIGLVAAGCAVVPGRRLVAQQPGTILTVIPSPGAAGVDFSDADLTAMATETFTTTTIWTEGEVEFSGPPLAEVLRAAGLAADVRRLRLTALNDYSVEIETDRIEAAAPIIANRIDGQPFSVRDKGPLWLVFPYDSDARFRSESVFAVSVWQLRRIEAL
ncbi:molybdopterin-dependent oxidoreductase [Roseicyclus persicicus]|uniref:Molybdopterin-dependent oxidoreductase n=1 Tax=Roseicyclus persicicus TaxID=2650661 RepID=A0A7X6GVL3_9RHOB|nr:molybdopterin-dependent oxidoreductase [Roseibacterium persicicum]NKX43202.1 molybdopterin-dependent oxidoreductase [Roseibacterium persicicum]